MLIWNVVGYLPNVLQYNTVNIRVPGQMFDTYYTANTCNLFYLFFFLQKPKSVWLYIVKYIKKTLHLFTNNLSSETNSLGVFPMYSSIATRSNVYY